MSAYDIPGNHENVPERGWDQEADHVALEAVMKLANELTAPAGPNYRDDWACGYDAGREAAGQELVKVLREQGFIQ